MQYADLIFHKIREIQQILVTLHGYITCILKFLRPSCVLQNTIMPKWFVAMREKREKKQKTPVLAPAWVLYDASNFVRPQC